MEAIGMMRAYGQPVDYIVHIGANNGLESAAYFSSGAKEVLYVEPIPSVFDELALKISSMPGHRALNTLCLDVAGKSVDFNIANNNGESSSVFGLGNHAILHPEVEYTNKISIISTTVDEILEKNCSFNQVSLLVIDAQGAELLILKGAIETLKYTSSIYCEVSDIRLYEGSCLWIEIVDFLQELGFALKNMHIGGHHYGNAFFVKEDLIVVGGERPLSRFRSLLGQPIGRAGDQ